MDQRPPTIETERLKLIVLLPDELEALVAGDTERAGRSAGNTYFEGDPITRGSLLYSGGVFIGGRTPLGPVYLAYAVAEGDRSRVYFNLGGRF